MGEHVVETTYLLLIIHYVREAESMKIQKIKFVPSRNVEPAKGQIKNMSQAISRFKWHKQETSYLGDAQRRAVTLGRGDGYGFSEGLIFEMSFQGWVEF